MGKDMIRTAELRSILTDIDQFKSAVNTFYGKYNCIPGDCPNATNFFGTDSNGCPVGGGATGTCNGDGNGNIDYYSYESFQAWKQLAFAGLISGTFSGTDAAWQARVGINIPSSRLAGVGYSIGYFNIAGTVNPAQQLTGSISTNRILVGRECVSQMNCASFATPAEVNAIDTKIDDGFSAKGMLTVLDSGYSSPDTNFLGTCSWWGASVNDPGTAYAMDASRRDQLYCNMIFTLGK